MESVYEAVENGKLKTPAMMADNDIQVISRNSCREAIWVKYLRLFGSLR